MNFENLDFPPKVLTIVLLMLAFIGMTIGRESEFGTYMAIACIGLWFGWVIVWNYIVKPRL